MTLFFERLSWRIPFVSQKPSLRVGIIAKPNEPRAPVVANTIARWADEHGVELLADNTIKGLPRSATPCPQERCADSTDFLVVLGGDGTMIAAARLVGGRGTPLIERSL